MKIEIHELNENDLVTFKHGDNLEFEDEGRVLELWEDDGFLSVRCEAIDDIVDIHCSQITEVDQTTVQSVDWHNQLQIDLARGK